MVVLVRCKDETCAVALESCLEGLMKGGLITAWLDKGEWVTVSGVVHTRRTLAPLRRAPDRVLTASVA